MHLIQKTQAVTTTTETAICGHWITARICSGKLKYRRKEVMQEFYVPATHLTDSSFKCIDPWGTDENTPNGNDCALSNSSHFVAISAVAYYK